MCKKFIPVYNSAKIIKTDRDSKVMITNVLPPFYGSQCIILVINTNLHRISHRFQVIADYWSNPRFARGIPVFNTLARGEP